MKPAYIIAFFVIAVCMGVTLFTLSGSLEVLARSIEMDLDVPFLLRPFKGQALSVIEGEINEWIQKAKTGAV